MNELVQAGSGRGGGGGGGGARGSAEGWEGDWGKQGAGMRIKLLYVTPEMLVKSGKLASALEALALR